MIQNLGRETCLSPFQREHAWKGVLKDRNTYSKMMEDESIGVIRDGATNCAK